MKITTDCWYNVDGKFACYSPVRAMRSVKEDTWEVETEDGVRMTIPLCDIISEVEPRRESESNTPEHPYTLLSAVEPEPVEWLWTGRIPLGEITVLQGDPGCNKSCITIDLAARVTTGREMPDGSAGVWGGVVLLQAEDSVSKTVPLRATAAGADLRRIAVIQDISIPDDLDILRRAVIAVRAKLVILDPLLCFLSQDANREQAVRRALRPLRRLAEDHGIAVVVIRHLNKGGSRNVHYRGGGSIAITATVRSEFLIAPSPADEHLRILAHAKSNLGPISPSLLFEPVPGGGNVRLEWRGECDYSAADLLGKPKEVRPALDAAMEVLLKTLAGGPVDAIEVQRRASAAGISMRTLERGKKELGVTAYRCGNGRHRPWVWTLPGTDKKDD